MYNTQLQSPVLQTLYLMNDEDVDTMLQTNATYYPDYLLVSCTTIHERSHSLLLYISFKLAATYKSFYDVLQCA